MALGLPSDPAQQKRLLIGLVPLLLVFAYWYFLHGDYKTQALALETRLESLEALNANARMRSTQSRQLEERLVQFERHIDRLEDLVPRSEEVSQLLNQISERATEVGVEVARFNPGATDVGTHYNRRTFQMTILGSYHEIGRFLSEIGSLPRIITPREVSVTPGDPRGGRPGEQVLEASFMIETYVLPETAPATTTGAAGA